MKFASPSQTERDYDVHPPTGYSNAVVPKVCSADPKGSTISSQGIHGYLSVMVTFKFTTYFVKNNHRTSLIGDVFILYDRISNEETSCTHEANDGGKRFLGTHVLDYTVSHPLQQ